MEQRVRGPNHLCYAHQPCFVSEFGGIWWNEELARQAQHESADDPERADSWGYGERVRMLEEWHERFAGLTNPLLSNPDMFGYCYTQLTDVFQEQNGLYDFHSRPKVEIRRVAEVQRQAAAYERE